MKQFIFLIICFFLIQISGHSQEDQAGIALDLKKARAKSPGDQFGLLQT